MSDCVFCDILRGVEAGDFIASDDAQRFAMIRNARPEAAVHWLALPYEHHAGTETLELADGARFAALLQFATATARAQVADYPELARGFTVKYHVGSFESLPHAKLHIVSVE